MSDSNSKARGFSPGSTAELSDRLHSAAIHLLRMLRREDDATGLSAPRLSALSVVVFAGPVTLGELARAEQVRPPTMTRIVQALEKDGYLRKASHPKDGRAVLLTATTLGRRTLSEGRRRRLSALQKELEKLAEADLNRLREGAGILEKMLQTGPCEEGRGD